MQISLVGQRKLPVQRIQTQQQQKSNKLAFGSKEKTAEVMVKHMPVGDLIEFLLKRIGTLTEEIDASHKKIIGYLPDKNKLNDSQMDIVRQEQATVYKDTVSRNAFQEILDTLLLRNE